MQGNPDVLQALNTCLRDQLTIINQTFLHARMAKDWGLSGFNDREYGHSIKAMKQADALIERVLFLEGLPNLQDLGKLMVGENIPEMIGGDLALHTATRDSLLAGVRLCEQLSDFISRELLEEILDAVEDRIDEYETQQWQIENTGLENYLQSQSGDET